MKFTKTLAVAGILGAALLAFAACRDSSGDADLAAALASFGVPKKYALQMTVDATGNNIKVGDEAITDSNNTSAKGKIIADDADGDAALKLSATGKRAFKEISPGLNNTEGFRTNIVLDLANGTWTKNKRVAGAGMLFDFNKYKVGNEDAYDFFFLLFKPNFTSGGAFNGVVCYFERYSEVKEYKKGIYSGNIEASALGSNYIQTAVGTWDPDLYTPDAKETWQKDLTTSDYVYNEEAGTVVIGVDVKQFAKGLYTVRIGKISYTVGDAESETAQEFTPSAFKQSWHTKFTAGTTMGKGGDPAGASCISSYDNWTHVDGDDSNLKGAVLVYGFAPYGTKPIASFYTCNTKLNSNKTDNTDSRYDYVGDWNVANTLDTDEGKSTVIYEDGVETEYFYY